MRQKGCLFVSPEISPSIERCRGQRTIWHGLQIRD